MKKNISYYLENTSRLSEVSLKELNAWSEEMPYSQPLKMLVAMKAEMEGASSEVGYSAYFAEDYEPITFDADKIVIGEGEQVSEGLDEITGKGVPAATAVVGLSQMGYEEIVDSKKETNPLETKGEMTTERIDKSIKEVIHEATDDFQEDVIEEDLMEINPNTVLVNEVSHPEADEVGEFFIEEELMENSAVLIEEDELLVKEELPKEGKVNLIEGIPIFEAGKVDEETSIIMSPDAMEGYDAIIENMPQVPEGDLMSEEELAELGGAEELGSVIDFINDREGSGEDSAVHDETKDLNALEDDGQGEQQFSQVNYNEFVVSVDTDKKKKKKKKKSKKDKVERIEGQLVDIQSETKGTVIATEVIEETKKEKKKSKKKLTRKKLKTIAKKKHKKHKGKKNKNRYVILEAEGNGAKTNDFKLKDFNGVSDFTSWLLEHNKGKESEMRKKKKGKKSKSKETYADKVAKKSIKKSEIIISEPLAMILANQGHIKKAKKMYKQLSLIFPEKSSYFAAQIENLKNK